MTAIIVCPRCGDAFWADRHSDCPAIADRSAPAPRRETGVARKGESGGAGTAIAQGQAMNP